jgi:hypothetical protein
MVADLHDYGVMELRSSGKDAARREEGSAFERTPKQALTKKRSPSGLAPLQTPLARKAFAELRNFITRFALHPSGTRHLARGEVSERREERSPPSGEHGTLEPR